MYHLYYPIHTSHSIRSTKPKQLIYTVSVNSYETITDGKRESVTVFNTWRSTHRGGLGAHPSWWFSQIWNISIIRTPAPIIVHLCIKNIAFKVWLSHTYVYITKYKRIKNKQQAWMKGNTRRVNLCSWTEC